MEEFKNITRKDIQEKLMGENLKINRILSIALCVGALLFLIIIIILYQINLSSNLEILENNAVGEMIIILSFLAFGVYSIYFILPKIFLKRENLIKQLSTPRVDRNNKIITDPVTKLIVIDRILMIIRLALLEGVAIFAQVTLILSVFSGLIYHNNNYWLLTIPLFILIYVVLTNYISEEKIISRIESDILFNLQSP